jgi:hypothetical protein
MAVLIKSPIFLVSGIGISHSDVVWSPELGSTSVHCAATCVRCAARDVEQTCQSVSQLVSEYVHRAALRTQLERHRQ